MFLSENASESDSQQHRSFQPIICHVCGANCVDMLVLRLLLSSTLFSSSSLKSFLTPFLGGFQLKIQRKFKNSDSTDSMSANVNVLALFDKHAV